MKTSIKNMFLHFRKIQTHRKWVRYYGKFAGLPFKQRWTHDLSKYSPIEFFESIKYYQGTSSPINACKKENGYSLAWLHHKGRNPHHYEYWQDNFDKGGEPIKMPYKYWVEMVCDYLAAARAYMGDNFSYLNELEWWNKKKLSCAMHEDNKRAMTKVFEVLAKSGCLLSKGGFKLLLEAAYNVNS